MHIYSYLQFHIFNVIWNTKLLILLIRPIFSTRGVYILEGETLIVPWIHLMDCRREMEVLWNSTYFAKKISENIQQGKGNGLKSMEKNNYTGEFTIAIDTKVPHF